MIPPARFCNKSLGGGIISGAAKNVIWGEGRDVWRHVNFEYGEANKFLYGKVGLILDSIEINLQYIFSVNTSNIDLRICFKCF